MLFKSYLLFMLDKGMPLLPLSLDPVISSSPITSGLWLGGDCWPALEVSLFPLPLPCGRTGCLCVVVGLRMRMYDLPCLRKGSYHYLRSLISLYPDKNDCHWLVSLSSFRLLFCNVSIHVCSSGFKATLLAPMYLYSVLTRPQSWFKTWPSCLDQGENQSQPHPQSSSSRSCLALHVRACFEIYSTKSTNWAVNLSHYSLQENRHRSFQTT